MPLPTLIGLAIAYFRKQKWIEHSLKVYAYAQGIGGEEGLSDSDMLTLGAAALLHDIGIPPAKERYGSAAGSRQEEEGARAAPAILAKADVPEEMRDRIVWLVGHHHQENLAKDDRLLQILMEADYLVNLAEGNHPDKDPRGVLETFFRTETGKRYLRDLFAL